MLLQPDPLNYTTAGLNTTVVRVNDTGSCHCNFSGWLYSFQLLIRGLLTRTLLELCNTLKHYYVVRSLD